MIKMRRHSIIRSKLNLSTFRDFLCRNKLLAVMFFVSSVYFMIQHFFYLSWDFSVYAENSKYLFSGGNYFELMRPPLMPLLIGIASLFKFYDPGEYIFIVLANLLYLFMCYRLSQKLNVNKALFYALCLNPYVLSWGLFNGTEMLALSLVGLFIFYLSEEKDAGFLLGLAFLARYTVLPLSVLLLFYKKPVKILKNAVYLLLPVLLWLSYDHLLAGSPFSSIADSYANNILSRQHMIQPFDFTDILFAGNMLLALSAYYIYRLMKDRKFRILQAKEWKMSIIMVLVIASAIYSYASTPFKDPRYLFNLTLPFAYFSAKGLASFFGNRHGSSSNKNDYRYNNIAFAIGIIFLIIGFLGLLIISPHDSIIKKDFEKDIAEINGLGIKNCSIRSDAWPLLNHYGYRSNFNKDLLTEKYLEKGEVLVLFPKYGEYKYEDMDRLDKKFVLKKTKDYIVLKDPDKKCKDAERIFHSFLSGYNESLYLLKNKTIEIRPLSVLLGDLEYDGSVG